MLSGAQHVSASFAAVGAPCLPPFAYVGFDVNLVVSGLGTLMLSSCSLKLGGSEFQDYFLGSSVCPIFIGVSCFCYGGLL